MEAVAVLKDSSPEEAVCRICFEGHCGRHVIRYELLALMRSMWHVIFGAVMRAACAFAKRTNAQVMSPVFERGG
eukprot:3622730-Amphidinium_carterae.1